MASVFHGLTGILVPLSEVARILNAIQPGDNKAADQLLPLVYDELHRLDASGAFVPLDFETMTNTSRTLQQ